jgi:hypothetical protein
MTSQQQDRRQKFEIVTHSKIVNEFIASRNAESIELAIEEQVQIMPEYHMVIVIATASSFVAAAAVCG